MHLVMVAIAVGFILPRWFDVFIPIERRGESDVPTVPGVSRGEELTAQPTVDSGRGMFDKDLAHGSANYGSKEDYSVKTAY